MYSSCILVFPFNLIRYHPVSFLWIKHGRTVGHRIKITKIFVCYCIYQLHIDSAKMIILNVCFKLI